MANLCVQIRFWPSLITSSLITLIIYIGVYFNTRSDLYQMFLFSLIYLPVLTFSLYISWSSTLKSRMVFLQHTLNEYNRQAFENMAHTDSLTGLNNRRCFEYLAQQLVQQNFDQPVPMNLLVFDVDHFKQINDRYGHDIGDQVLQTIALSTRSEMRQHDILAHYGGEEFIAFLPETSLDEALKVAERLRHNIENIVIDLDSQHRFSFSISIGAAILESCETDLMTLIKQADIALYQAKANGRNRVEAYDPDLEQSLAGELQNWQVKPA
nr:GGDEF domain-containing protein [Acinetobacter lwoffii]